MNREITYSGTDIHEVAAVLKEADEVIKSMFKGSTSRAEAGDNVPPYHSGSEKSEGVLIKN